MGVQRRKESGLEYIFKETGPCKRGMEQLTKVQVTGIRNAAVIDSSLGKTTGTSQAMALSEGGKREATESTAISLPTGEGTGPEGVDVRELMRTVAFSNEEARDFAEQAIICNKVAVEAELILCKHLVVRIKEHLNCSNFCFWPL